ncbi:unnamed protein product [Pylaiella littoralis]
MKSRPMLAIRRSLVGPMLALFRGSAALRWPYSGRVAPRVFAIPATSASCIAAVSRSGQQRVLDQGHTKARRWDIPWGNDVRKNNHEDGGGDTDAKLTRTLKVLPDAAANVEESDCFRVMSFNMLAQQMASSKMFPYVAKNQLKKNNRWPRVRAEVSRYGADVICLQECESFEEILASIQEDNAHKGPQFAGFYKRRNNNEHSHGVAILYDSKARATFRLLKSGSCAYGRKLCEGVGAFALLQDRCRRPDETVEINGGSLTTNGDGSDGRKGGRGESSAKEGRRGAAKTFGVICVVTTHLFWHPDGAAVRLAQAEILMIKLAAFLRKRFGDNYSSIPVVLAGDLNNVPGVDVYRLLSSGTCEGGTPEAFHRRRHERSRAPKAEQVKRARAVLAGVRARNAAVISASRKGSAAGEDEGEIPPSPTIADSDSGGASAASSVAASKSASGSNTPRDEGDTSAQTANEPSGDRDGDVRRYEQGFRGLSSAYGAYSSVFSSQLSKRYPAGKSSVCETTGQLSMGHVRLGARRSGENVDSGGSREDSEGRREESDRSMGEPQLTTCTNNFAGTIDYIWHTPQLGVRSLLDLPSFKQAMQGGGLPSAAYPSDHVSILAELHWRHQAQESDDRDTPASQ